MARPSAPSRSRSKASSSPITPCSHSRKCRSPISSAARSTPSNSGSTAAHERRRRPRSGQPRGYPMTVPSDGERIVYLSGEFLPLANAKISVLDRGFIYGDGVYEVVPVYRRRPFRMAEHLARLSHSLAGIRLADPHPARWTEIIGQLVARQPFDDQSVYLQVT